MVEPVLALLDVGVVPVVVLSVALVALAVSLLSRGARLASLRPIAAYEALRQAPTRAVESGLPLHVSLGSGAVGTEATPETAAALQVARHLVEGGSAGTPRTILTVGDGTVFAGAVGLADAAFSANADVLFAGPSPMAYAAGATAVAYAEPASAHVLLGSYGDEGLWLAGALSTGIRTPVGGTVEPAAAALMYTAMDEAVVGEEIYAAGAYLGDENQVASLVAADALRLMGVLALVLGTLGISLGWWR